MTDQPHHRRSKPRSSPYVLQRINPLRPGLTVGRPRTSSPCREGMWRADAIARAPRVQRLLFGAIDLSIDLGISGVDEALLYARSHVVLVSRVAGIQAPVDGPTTSIDSIDRVRADAQRARRLGFGGKLSIHPNQVAPVHESFGPTAEEVAWARRVIEAAAASSGAATSVDGEMVDRPVLLRAQSIVSRASS